jgi:hypothetical protein
LRARESYSLVIHRRRRREGHFYKEGRKGGKMKEAEFLAMDGTRIKHDAEKTFNRRERSQAKLGTNMKTTEIRRHGRCKTGES